MWKIVFLLAFVKSGICGIFDFTEYDDPYYNNFFFNRPAAIIRQHHGRCTTTLGGNNLEGVCLSRPECTLSGGRPQGRQSCILGTCCVYSRGCNQISTKRVSYFEGTSTTTDNNNECSYTVRAESASICQMRLDFDSLNFPNPSRTTIPDTINLGQTIQTGSYTCRNGFFQVSNPSTVRIPTLCGNNNGQHIYVPVNASRGERDLVVKVVTNFINNNNNGNSLSWKIKITQLECPSLTKHQKPIRAWEDSLLVAPAGCLQYYLNPSDTIRNLGFATTNTATGTNLANNHYEANLNYAICFRRTPDMCGMDFVVDQFSLSGGDPASTTDTCSYPLDPANPTGTQQDSDFLFVPNGVFTNVGDPVNAIDPSVSIRDRYCGIIGPTSVIRSVTPGPFYIFFKTDNRVLDTTYNPFPDPANPPVAGTTDQENGWELTYSTLYGTTCGTNV